MTAKPKPKAPLIRARERIAALLDQYPAVGRTILLEHWVKEAPGKERTAAMRYGIDRLLGEIERERVGPARLRRAERAIGAEGEQLILPLLQMTFAQAEATIERRQLHARGELHHAQFDTRVIAIAKKRCRERGLDPYDIEFRVGQFIDEAEIAEMRKAA